MSQIPVTTSEEQKQPSLIINTTTAPPPPKILTDEEIRIKSFIESLNLTFQYKWELEHHELITKGSNNNPVIPLIVISVDKMLSKEERAMIPNIFENNIRIQMEYVMTLDPNDESVQKELEEEQKQINTINGGEGIEITMEGDEEFEEFEEDEDDEDN
ncbi:hypothetical protein DDB_G0279351 [Dictyostelium discoideum AX4]|uniref:Uncharacterized protein n=1 Tax=Dictyostelium discoideum TaxID=44689 RepID=Q54WW8_DICDI|nr:hypothetical protein DDB_G0279351 [Dictyostelium discoideum AX4]EAL67824.1 hypothetical protein DDB_G0279351 [Dictyostelium discoideum AX4]|eukprot:XP_641809.1 hypothetical protein DDB_G0279351 [Dictyostelium discoideum AX4]